MKHAKAPSLPGCLLAVFAHPDDEAYRPGGTLALLAGRGVTVHLLTATRGEAGSCGDPPLCNREELPAVRERELRCACAALGIQPAILLDCRDGHLSEANPEQVITQILQMVRRVGAEVILTFGPDGLSGHPDHIAIGSWAEEAFRRSDTVSELYTVAVPQSLAKRMGMAQVRSVPDEDISVTVDVSPVWKRKMAAIRCHATQVSSSPILRASMERQQMFLSTESFVRACTGNSAATFFDRLNAQ